MTVPDTDTAPGRDAADRHRPTARRLALTALLAGAVVVVLAAPAVLLIAGPRAGASFGDAEPVGANRLGAATLDIDLDATSSALEVSDMAPGDQATGSVAIRNAGSLPMRYVVRLEHDGDPLVEVLRWDAWFASACAAGPLSAPAPDRLLLDAPIGSTLVDDRPLAPTEVDTLCLRATLPATTANDYQGRVLEVTIHADAEHDLAASEEDAP